MEHRSYLPDARLRKAMRSAQSSADSTRIFIRWPGISASGSVSQRLRVVSDQTIGEDVSATE